MDVSVSKADTDNLFSKGEELHLPGILEGSSFLQATDRNVNRSFAYNIKHVVHVNFHENQVNILERGLGVNMLQRTSGLQFLSASLYVSKRGAY